MMKKSTVFIASVATVCAAGLSTVFVHGNDQPVPVSKEEVIETTRVSDEEKDSLSRLGISYDDIVEQSKKETEVLEASLKVGDQDQKVLFLSDGSWISGEGGTVWDHSGIKVADYNPEKDQNSVSWDEAMELNTMKNIRNRVDSALGKD